MFRVAVLSDTHGRLPSLALAETRGVDLILHAGDVGDPDILERLSEHAPVVAVRGNVDTHGPMARLPEVAHGALADGLTYRMVHRYDDLDERWLQDTDLLIFGHSHRPELAWRRGCLLLNPGAVGPRRFKLPLTMARITVVQGRIVPEIVAVEELPPA